jgi:hypothetical protein
MGPLLDAISPKNHQNTCRVLKTYTHLFRHCDSMLPPNFGYTDLCYIWKTEFPKMCMYKG